MHRLVSNKYQTRSILNKKWMSFKTKVAPPDPLGSKLGHPSLPIQSFVCCLLQEKKLTRCFSSTCPLLSQMLDPGSNSHRHRKHEHYRLSYPSGVDLFSFCIWKTFYPGTYSYRMARKLLWPIGRKIHTTHWLLNTQTYVDAENFAFGNLRISRAFFKFDGGFDFFDNVKKTEKIQVRFSSAKISTDQIYRGGDAWCYLVPIALHLLCTSVREGSATQHIKVWVCSILHNSVSQALWKNSYNNHGLLSAPPSVCYLPACRLPARPLQGRRRRLRTLIPRGLLLWGL